MATAPAAHAAAHAGAERPFEQASSSSVLVAELLSAWLRKRIAAAIA
jgi:hypothetical protein